MALFIVIAAMIILLVCYVKREERVPVVEWNVTSEIEVIENTNKPEPVKTPDPKPGAEPTVAPEATMKPEANQTEAPEVTKVPVPQQCTVLAADTESTETLTEGDESESDAEEEKLDEFEAEEGTTDESGAEEEVTDESETETEGTDESTPAWMVLFETDVEDGTVGEKPATGSDVNEWTQIVENISKLLYTRVAEEETDKVLHIYCGEGGSKGGPRASRNIQIKGMEKITVEFQVKTEGATSYIAYYIDATTNLWSGKSEDKWTDIKLEIDLLNKNFITYVNGTQSGEATAISYGEDVSTLEFRFSAGTVQPGTGIYLDDIKISGYGIPTPDESILGDDNTVNWENVVPENELSENSLVNNLADHPRILVSEWEKIYQRITNSGDETITIWYNNLKADADSYLDTDPPGYANSNGRNQLIEARAGRERVMSLSFVYNIEKLAGNPNAHLYMEKAYSDMIAMGEWQDWSAFSAYLVTGELMFGYACAYDWLYYDLTAQQKAAIYEVVQEQALTGLVYNYEGVKTSTNFTTNSINWNPVCNAGAIGAAFAFGDEQPLIAEYILEKAPEYITNCLEPYAPQGGYPEGAMYWGLGTNFLTIAMHLLDNGFTEEYDIYNRYPNWEYAKAEGIAETGDYHIYYNGTDGRFNYGDASRETVSYAAIYYLSDRFDKPEYAWYENELQKDLGIYLSGYEAIAAICFYDPEKAVDEPGDFSLDKFYYSEQDVNGIVMRSDWEDKDALYTAMQGGNNIENHMHLSLGTYVIDYHGKRFVEDIYASNYSLSGAKNTIYYKRAEAYNTLIINPSDEGEQYFEGMATVTRYGTSDNTAFGIMDMSKAYNVGDAAIISAERGMMLTDDRNRVIVQDEVKLDKASEFYWFANTAASVRIATDGKSAILEQDGERMLVRISEGPEDAVFSTMGRTSLVAGVQNTVNSGIKLVIHLENISELNLAVEYVGLEDGEGIPEVWNYVPMAQWTADDDDTVDAELGIKLYADDKELTLFHPERQRYALDFAKDATNPAIITVIADEGITVNVKQASCIGTYAETTADNNGDGIADDTAVVTVISEGNTYTYYIKMQYDPFEDALSNKDEGVLYSMKAELEGVQLPDEDNFIKVVDLEASEWGSYPKFGIVDGVINSEIANRWASNASDCWIIMDFGESKNLHSMAFAGVSQTARAYDFDVQVSADGENWTTVHTDGAQTTEEWMYIIDFDETTYADALSNVRYVKMLGKGYNDGSGKWNTWAEVRFYESHEKEQTDKTYWDAYFITAFEGEAGAEKQIVVTGHDYNKNVVDLSEATVIYEVADKSIVNVSEDGKLTFLKEGATTIIVKAVKAGFTASVECDVVCTGGSITESYTITFLDYQGNTLTGDAYNLVLVEGSTIIVPEAPAREGYIFTGWLLNDSDPAVYLTAGAKAEADAVYMAEYTNTTITPPEEEKVTITFDKNNGEETVVNEYAEGTVLSAENIPADPEKTGSGAVTYEFVGWQDAAGNTLTVGTTTATTNAAYKATYKVTTVAFTTDFSDTPVNTDNIPLKTSEADGDGNSGHWDRVVYNTANSCFVKVEDEQLHLYCGTSPKSKNPRVDKMLDLNIYTRVDVNFKVKMDGKNSQIQCRYADKTIKLLALASSVYADWVNVRLEMIYTSTGWTCTAYVNGEVSGTYQNVVLGDVGENSAYLSFETVTLAANTGVYYDDITIIGTKFE